MITDIVLQAAQRSEVGKNASRRLRAAGRLPVAVYGEGLEPVSASIVGRELGALLRSEAGRHAIFTLAIEGGESSPVKIQKIDTDPVTSKILHLDLVRLSMTQKTRVKVPLEFVGEPVGVKVDGGMQEVHLYDVEIECFPGDMPGSLKIDVSGLRAGQHVNVGDIIIDNDNVTITTPAEYLVLAIVGKVVQTDEVEPEG